MIFRLTNTFIFVFMHIKHSVMIILLSSLSEIKQNSVDQISSHNTHDPEKLDKSLFTENNDLGFIIKKNPQNGMIKRKVHEGEVSGYYYNNHVGYYVMYFRDYTGISYSTEHNHLNPTQYTSPQAVINIISEVLPAYNKIVDKDKDMSYINTLYIMTIRIDNIKTIKQVVDKFSDYHVSFELNEFFKQSHYYSVIIKTKRTIYHLLNFTQVIFTTILSTNSISAYHVSDSSASKLIKCVNIINAPYYVRYIMASRILYLKDFNILKQELENYNDHKITLNHGTTAQHRRNFIKKIFSFKNDIIDIGCGDGSYAIPFCKKIEQGLLYHAYDIDQEQLKILNKKIIKNNILNIKVYNSLEEFYDQLIQAKNVDIIITEVVEHMGEQDSRNFLIDVLNMVSDKFNKIIITTPNYEFNDNYCLNGKFRHWDHKWEMKRDQFQKFINDIIQSIKCTYKYDVKFVDIGDVVDGISCTQGVIISK